MKSVIIEYVVAIITFVRPAFLTCMLQVLVCAWIAVDAGGERKWVLGSDWSTMVNVFKDFS